MPNFKFRDLILDRYRILRIFGEGAMNEGVFYCQDMQTEAGSYSSSKRREVVVKILNATDGERGADRIKQEATTQAALNHKNLVKIYDTVFKDGLIYIVMEYIASKDNSTLADRIKKRGLLSRADAIYVFKQVLEGMQALQNGPHTIVHLDLKPENIMVSMDGSEVKITDFGISAIVSPDGKVMSKEIDDRGTAGYVSPLFKYEGKDRVEISPVYDYFALGVIFFEMLTGEWPWKKREGDDGETLANVLSRAREFYPPLLTNYGLKTPNLLYNIIFRLTVTRPKDRKFWYKNVEEIIADVVRAEKNLDEDEPLLVKQVKDPSFENPAIYAIELERARQKAYTQPWFAVLITCFGAGMIGAIVTLAVLLSYGIV